MGIDPLVSVQIETLNKIFYSFKTDGKNMKILNKWITPSFSRGGIVCYHDQLLDLLDGNDEKELTDIELAFYSRKYEYPKPTKVRIVKYADGFPMFTINDKQPANLYPVVIVIEIYDKE